MTEQPRWGIGADQYRKRPRRQTGDHNSHDDIPVLRAPASESFALTGITWDSSAIDLGLFGGTGNVERARTRFRHRFPTMIWDAARLEGNTFTLPEVRTLLDGVTVSGKSLDDQNQILALNEGFNRLDALVGDRSFSLSKPVSDEIHALVAVHESIEAGSFRGEGSVTGGGNVRLSRGGTVEGRAHGTGGVDLLNRYQDLLDYLSTEPDPRLRALVYAASTIRHQLYFDGNKRTAKLMASGELISHGFDAISVPYTRLFEQNVALDRLFSTDDATDLMVLFADCAC
jgi:hypothetical protein